MSIIGFENQKKYFSSAAQSAALAHAYLFSGPEMIGKRLFAQEIFFLANNRPEENHEPDLITIAPSEGGAIMIDQIRDLKQTLTLVPYRGPYRAVIIDDAHRVTSEAANALLKILEEPSPSTLFILVSHQSDLLPETILSRCQEVRFAGHDDTTVRLALKNLKLSADDLDLVVSTAGGRIGWAIVMAQPIRLKQLKKSITDFQKLLKEPISARLMYAKKIYEKEEYITAVPQWLHWAYSHQGDLSHPPATLQHLLTLNTLISQSQYNHRLILENTLINL